MTPATAAAHARLIGQPVIYVSRRGEALSRWQFLAVSVKPKPVSLPDPMPERRAT